MKVEEIPDVLLNDWWPLEVQQKQVTKEQITLKMETFYVDQLFEKQNNEGNPVWIIPRHGLVKQICFSLK